MAAEWWTIGGQPGFAGQGSMSIEDESLEHLGKEKGEHKGVKNLFISLSPLTQMHFAKMAKLC